MRRIARVMFFHPRDSSVGPIVSCEMTFWVRVDFHHLIAFVKAIWMEVIRLGIEEAVELLESALQRPGPAVTGVVDVVAPRVVPLADHHGRVAIGPQNFWQGRRVQCDFAAVTRIARIGVRNPTASYAVRILAG